MEIIGLFIVMTILILLSCAIGLFFALAVRVMTRKLQWRKPTLVAGLFPPATAAYLLACLVFSGIVSQFLGTPDLVFGDVVEPLPNGYELHALDKMPEAGTIQKSGNSLAAVGWVGELQASSFTVLGKYDYTYFPQAAGESGRNFFLFDTRSGSVKNFTTEAALAEAAHTQPHLVATSRFHGPKTLWQTVAISAMLFISFFPPTALAALLLWRLRRYLKGAEGTHVDDISPPTLTA